MCSCRRAFAQARPFPAMSPLILVNRKAFGDSAQRPSLSLWIRKNRHHICHVLRLLKCSQHRASFCPGGVPYLCQLRHQLQKFGDRIFGGVVSPFVGSEAREWRECVGSGTVWLERGEPVASQPRVAGTTPAHRILLGNAVQPEASSWTSLCPVSCSIEHR